MISARLGRLAASVCIAMLLTGCTTMRPPAPPRPETGAQCLAKLRSAGTLFDVAAVPVGANGCGIVNAVKLRRTTLDWPEPGIMSCALAARFAAFEADILQPAARRHLHRPVTALDHFGTFECRRESSGRDRLSQHAFGNAIDIAGFRLSDRTSVTIAADWRGSGEKSAFLHEVAQGACRYFSVVLTPASNSAHRDHLHLDVGPYKLCGA